MEHRLALNPDIDRIMEIVRDAQSFLKSNGVDQWQDGYPNREVYETDIRNGSCHVFMIDGIVAGLISVFFEREECYDHLENGKWLTGDAPYAAFHRAVVSSDYRGIGIAGKMLSYAENTALERGFKSMRGDTHPDNKAMRRLLEKRGFVLCGTIYLNGEKTARNERVCYEKLL